MQKFTWGSKRSSNFSQIISGVFLSASFVNDLELNLLRSSPSNSNIMWSTSLLAVCFSHRSDKIATLLKKSERIFQVCGCPGHYRIAYVFREKNPIIVKYYNNEMYATLTYLVSVKSVSVQTLFFLLFTNDISSSNCFRLERSKET